MAGTWIISYQTKYSAKTKDKSSAGNDLPTESNKLATPFTW